jgi:deoxyribodipyrimidine photo-lyase
MEKALDTALVWFRRDLRADDHAALYHGLKAARRVYAVFVFDLDILQPLLERGLRQDRRVEFIRDSLIDLDAQLRRLGAAHGVAAALLVRHARAVDEIPRLAAALQAQAVYANHDDDPQAVARDATVRGRLSDAGVAFHTSKDHVVFERSEILTRLGTPFSVFTPYKKAWLERLEDYYLSAYPVAKYAASLAAVPGEQLQGGIPSLDRLGFAPTNLRDLHLATGSAGAAEVRNDFLERIDRYHETRDYPAVKGPSYLSVHLRFGTVSVRKLAGDAHRRAVHGSKGAQTWLGELIWRDFYHQILHHHPHVTVRSFKPEYDAISWEHGKHASELFAAWCEGRTGYPLVDAAMAQINQSGYMHNRLRMVVASFLVKDLGIDWRWGERYFGDRLNDYDLAANNGGWQWAASTGCDAQPYFRIFNPVAQSERFDTAGKFIRRYLPQLARLPDALLHAPWLARPVDAAAAGIELGRDYPLPIVQHEEARARTLERYSVVRKARA